MTLQTHTSNRVGADPGPICASSSRSGTGRGAPLARGEHEASGTSRQDLSWVAQRPGFGCVARTSARAHEWKRRADGTWAKETPGESAKGGEAERPGGTGSASAPGRRHRAHWREPVPPREKAARPGGIRPNAGDGRAVQGSGRRRRRGGRACRSGGRRGGRPRRGQRRRRRRGSRPGGRSGSGWRRSRPGGAGRSAGGPSGRGAARSAGLNSSVAASGWPGWWAFVGTGTTRSQSGHLPCVGGFEALTLRRRPQGQKKRMKPSEVASWAPGAEAGLRSRTFAPHLEQTVRPSEPSGTFRTSPQRQIARGIGRFPRRGRVRGEAGGAGAAVGRFGCVRSARGRGRGPGGSPGGSPS